MGEAKRRKQLDSSYGSVPSLTSQNQKQKHVDLIIDGLSSKFAEEIKKIAAAESIIESYERYQQQVSSWLNLRLAAYQEPNQTLIASSIMTFYAEITMKQSASPLLIKFWFDVLPMLAEDKRRQIQAIAQQIEAEFASPSS